MIDQGASHAAMVRVTELAFNYGEKDSRVQALRDISFAIPRGSTCAIIGPSGSGKSTLLYLLSGLLEGYSGQVLVDGDRVYRGRRETALILQDHGLLPWKKVWDNAALGLDIRKVPENIKREKISAILKELGLWEMKDRYPSQLSGGQRQRVGIARALALDPDLLLMDEPFSSLDALTREALQKQLLHIWLKDRITIMLVTHSIEEAVFLGQKIIVLSAHPGRIAKIVDNPRAGTPEYRKNQEFYQMATGLRELLEQ
ncbi:ABC transporter ATP-binding protein [Desulforamulus ruminis]|uniref:ABC transporter related protein n=1 Tax=Desulforamulus ruminis (strain ATCC 23193 / DSM 2154 / NCIMB 8452 / DL) TaxID=696281 RepID=F6DVH9_DESRL|nr:ATP-binding cassette domain-containing protein [Desulforamulus ruminis]AEG61439.1 ABC transporter related protein [Desulforamulus ruminis DSM 2154]